MIYAIRCVSGPIKFGLAKNPKQRLEALQTANHRELYLFASCLTANDQDMEARIHEHCRPDLIRGEWFRLSDRTLKICAHINNGTLEKYLSSLPVRTLQTEYPVYQPPELAIVRYFLKKHAGHSSPVQHG